MAGAAYRVTRSDKFCFPQGTSTDYITKQNTKTKIKKAK